MKITSKTTPQNLLLLPKIPFPRRRNSKTTPRSNNSPPTPLLRWNFHQNSAAATTTGRRRRGAKGSVGKVNNVVAAAEKEEKSPRSEPITARKLGTGLWRMQLVKEEEKRRRWRRRRGEQRGSDGGVQLGFKAGIGHGVEQLSCHRCSREYGGESKDLRRSPCSVNAPVANDYLCGRQSPFQCVNYSMEGATKWDPISLKPSDENPVDSKLIDQKANATMISALETKLEQARARIEVLEVERRSSKKKVEHFLKKLSEERATWRIREHEKVRAVIDDVKSDLNRERRNRQRLEIVNSKLAKELAEVKLSVKRYMQDYEKEREARDLIEEVCDELAKEMGEDKAEVDSLKKECMNIRDEVEDERKMLQIAEVWREERVQMKLVDAKVALDQKYSQMNYLVEELKKFFISKGVVLDVNELREAELLQRAAASMNIQDIKEFTYEPSNSDDIFAVVEEMAMAESNGSDIKPYADYSPKSHSSNVRTVSPEMNSHNKDIHRLSNMYAYTSGDMDEDGSGWETVSHDDDQGSSYSPEGSIMSVNRMCRDSNASGSYTEWEEQVGEETPITEISEVCSVPSKQPKKVKSISRLWRSGPYNGDNYKTIPVDDVHGKLSNGRLTNGAMMSPDHGSSRSGISPSNMVGWSSPESRNSHINRGMTGCIEWPRGAQRNNLKNKLLEATVESQKIQLRHVLKQEI